jgi:caffeoyl-CoA O-methyltransferase
MEFIDPRLLQYCEDLSDGESDLLVTLNRQTHLKINNPRMLSGHLQGRFLSLFSNLQRPKRILEIGTYTGYSALCLAEGLHEDGILYTIDPNEETNVFARAFFEQSTYSSRIKLLEGQASEIIPALKETFDLVFIDADKKNYSLYYDLVIDKVVSNGIIIADNVLWSGKVLEQKMDADTLAIHQFNEKIKQDKRVSSTLLPLRDGLLMMRKL